MFISGNVLKLRLGNKDSGEKLWWYVVVNMLMNIIMLPQTILYRRN